MKYIYTKQHPLFHFIFDGNRSLQISDFRTKYFSKARDPAWNCIYWWFNRLEPLHLQILSFISRSYKLSATSWANRQIDEYGECHILMAGSRTTICRGLFLNGSFLMEPREMDMPNRGVPLYSFSHYSK